MKKQPTKKIRVSQNNIRKIKNGSGFSVSKVKKTEWAVSDDWEVWDDYLAKM